MQRAILVLTTLITLTGAAGTSAPDTMVFLAIGDVQPALEERDSVEVGHLIRTGTDGTVILVEDTGDCQVWTVVGVQQAYRVRSDVGKPCAGGSNPQQALQRAMSGQASVSKVLFKAVFMDALDKGDSLNEFHSDDFQEQLAALRSARGLVRARRSIDKCLHRKLNNWNNGNPIHIWDCDAGSSSMKTWVYDAKTGLVRAAHNKNKCWHKKLNDWSRGNPIHLWDCNVGPAANKTWDYEPKTGLIRARGNPSMCIHKKQGGFKNGNPVHLRGCGEGTTLFKSWLVR